MYVCVYVYVCLNSIAWVSSCAGVCEVSSIQNNDHQLGLSSDLPSGNDCYRSRTGSYGPVEIVDLPIEKWWIFPVRFLKLLESTRGYLDDPLFKNASKMVESSHAHSSPTSLAVCADKIMAHIPIEMAYVPTQKSPFVHCCKS